MSGAKQGHRQSHDEAMALIARARAGEACALDEMVRANLALVRSVCARFASRGADMEELYQLGCLGLVKAIKNFDAGYGVRFSSYAVPVIMGEIRRFLRDDGALTVGRRFKELAARALHAADRLRVELEREPTFAELAGALGCDPAELAQALESGRTVTSLDAPLGEEEGATLQDVLGAPQAEAGIDRLLLRQLLEQLPPEDRRLILLRYFRDRTQAETARMLGMTQVQVSRREAKIIQRFREAMAGLPREA
ncbi:MAG: sigma-70 family RNA polymerase sigma factor [Clostridia bacterium]|nr:sigma-70 family RNA polymerase sigma factor [Clostridia bacterium]